MQQDVAVDDSRARWGRSLPLGLFMLGFAWLETRVTGTRGLGAPVGVGLAFILGLMLSMLDRRPPISGRGVSNVFESVGVMAALYSTWLPGAPVRMLCLLAGAVTVLATRDIASRRDKKADPTARA